MIDQGSEIAMYVGVAGVLFGGAYLLTDTVLMRHGMMVAGLFRRQETNMTDERHDEVEALRVPEPDNEVARLAPPAITDRGPAAWTAGPDNVRELRPANLEDTMPGQNRWIGFSQDPLRAKAAVPKAMVSAHREACEHCGGTGFMPGISDYLRESAALLGDAGDQVIRDFYVALFRAAPDLVKLFPGDPTQGELGTDHRGAKQREKLLNAIVALSDLYDPDDGDKMARLDTALASFGRSHAAFVRQDGTIKGATIEEYAAVKEALFTTLVRATGDAWKPEYTEAWSQAYDYAAAVMLAEQHRSGFSAPRFPRA